MPPNESPAKEPVPTPILTIGQIQLIVESVIGNALTTHREITDKRFDKIESAMSTGLDGKKGFIQNAQELQVKVEALEASEKIRNRTVMGAVFAVATALGHTVWQLITTGHPN